MKKLIVCMFEKTLGSNFISVPSHDHVDFEIDRLIRFLNDNSSDLISEMYFPVGDILTLSTIRLAIYDGRIPAGLVEFRLYDHEMSRNYRVITHNSNGELDSESDLGFTSKLSNIIRKML